MRGDPKVDPNEVAMRYCPMGASIAAFVDFICRFVGMGYQI